MLTKKRLHLPWPESVPAGQTELRARNHIPSRNDDSSPPVATTDIDKAFVIARARLQPSLSLRIAKHPIHVPAHSFTPHPDIRDHEANQDCARDTTSFCIESAASSTTGRTRSISRYGEPGDSEADVWGGD